MLFELSDIITLPGFLGCLCVCVLLSVCMCLSAFLSVCAHQLSDKLLTGHSVFSQLVQSHLIRPDPFPVLSLSACHNKMHRDAKDTFMLLYSCPTVSPSQCTQVLFGRILSLTLNKTSTNIPLRLFHIN